MENLITGTTKIFFMIAHPIDHVRSPQVFNSTFQARRIDAIMIPLHVHPHDFSAVWAAMRKMRNLGGCIVSVPLKEAAFQLADAADYSAATVRAANSVRREEDGRLVCANFDGPGFMAGLLRNGDDAKDRDVLLLGAGGAGAAIALSLAKAGAASIRIADIDNDRAIRLAAAVREQFGRIRNHGRRAGSDGVQPRRQRDALRTASRDGSAAPRCHEADAGHAGRGYCHEARDDAASGGGAAGRLRRSLRRGDARQSGGTDHDVLRLLKAAARLTASKRRRRRPTSRANRNRSAA